MGYKDKKVETKNVTGIYTRNNKLRVLICALGQTRKITSPLEISTENIKFLYERKLALERQCENGEIKLHQIQSNDLIDSKNKEHLSQLPAPNIILLKVLLEQKLLYYKKRVNDQIQGKKKIKSTTYEDYERYTNSYLIPTFGHLAVDELSKIYVTNWINSLDISAKYFKNIIIPLKSVMKDCKDHKIIFDNPFENGYFENLADEILDESNEDPDPFNLEEIDLIINSEPSTIKDLLIFAIYTGLRVGELIALKQKNVMLNSGIIRVAEQVVRKKGILPKSKNSIRDVMILERAGNAIINQIQRSKNKQEFLFFNPNTDEPWSSSDVLNKNLKKYLVSLNIRSRTIHQARHTYASLLLSNGEIPAWVATQLGHRDSELVYRRYGHWIPQYGEKNGYKLVGNYS